MSNKNSNNSGASSHWMSQLLKTANPQDFAHQMYPPSQVIQVSYLYTNFSLVLDPRRWDLDLWQILNIFMLSIWIRFSVLCLSVMLISPTQNTTSRIELKYLGSMLKEPMISIFTLPRTLFPIRWLPGITKTTITRCALNWLLELREFFINPSKKVKVSLLNFSPKNCRIPTGWMYFWHYIQKRYCTVAQFDRYCQTGDILLFKDNHTFAKVQRFFTNSECDHVGMVFRDERYGICIF